MGVRVVLRLIAKDGAGIISVRRGLVIEARYPLERARIGCLDRIRRHFQRDDLAWRPPPVATI